VKSTCIVFIDEIDTIGKKRDVPAALAAVTMSANKPLISF
jgi:ATP-dependent 26S proteasome regulatory subunit